jgi:hypothetical protein
MVDVSSFKRNASAMRDGEWISPGPEYGDLLIKTRALGPAFQDARAAALRAAAKRHLTEDRIPSAEREAIVTDALIDHCLIDIKGLTDGGALVTIARFREMIRDPGFGELNNAAFIAAGLVGRSQAHETEAAVGNLQPASASS